MHLLMYSECAACAIKITKCEIAESIAYSLGSFPRGFGTYRYYLVITEVNL